MHKYFIGRTEWDKAWTEFYNHKATYFHVNETLRAPFYAAQRIRSKICRYTIYCGAASSYPLKGAHWLFRAIASLKEEFPNIQLRIAAAKGRLSTNRSMWERLKDDAYAMYLRRLIRELGIEKNIMLLPALSAEAVAEELKTCELFVLPSLCENSPNSLGEAMLVGTPSIATYVGGTPSILKDGIEGKLVPSGDAAALASAIRHWFRCPDDADACVAPAREVAIERHNAEKNVRETLTVYREIIKREAKEE
jgi:glycosyltransferase involved in cell wall biosynthesis